MSVLWYCDRVKFVWHLWIMNTQRPNWEVETRNFTIWLILYSIIDGEFIINPLSLFRPVALTFVIFRWLSFNISGIFLWILLRLFVMKEELYHGVYSINLKKKGMMFSILLVFWLQNILSTYIILYQRFFFFFLNPKIFL